MTEAHQQQRYQVVERLASGGMAEVYIAENRGIEGFKKRVAIKRILPHLGEKKKFIKMFLDEARLSAHLSHSNVAQVFDVGVGDNVYFIVMEYVDGSDLKAVIEFMKNSNRTFPVEAAVFIAAKLCEGLAYAHELQGPDGQPLKIVHRDMSPPNVLISKHGEVKIVDFGLAKATSQLEKSEPGIIKGKFSYLSPEAATGNDVDQRTDIFAVGIILWEMLAGRKLFQGDNDFATVKLVQAATIPPIRGINPAVPVELEPILYRALSRDPMARYPTARDLGRDLTRFLFSLGSAVSAYDIAELVRGAMALRKRSSPSKSSNIDKLIEDVLFEFTSLHEDKASGAKPAAPTPARGEGEFENISNWLEELNVAPPPAAGEDEAVKRLLSERARKGIEEGNLAALEDETGKHPVPEAAAAAAKAMKAARAAKEKEAGEKAEKGDKAGTKSTGARSAPPGAKPSPLAASKRPPPLAEPAKSSGATKVILLIVAIAILFAGAWFGGLIPH